MSGNLRLKSPGKLLAPLASLFGGAKASEKRGVDYTQMVELKTYRHDGYSHVRLPNGRELVMSADTTLYQDVETAKEADFDTVLEVLKEIARRDYLELSENHLQALRSDAHPYTGVIFEIKDIEVTRHEVTEKDGKKRSFNSLHLPDGSYLTDVGGYRDCISGQPVGDKFRKVCEEAIKRFEFKRKLEIKAQKSLAAPEAEKPKKDSKPKPRLSPKVKARILNRPY